MRPFRSITELLCGPAIAITGRSDHSTAGKAGASARAPAPRPDGPFRRDLRSLAGFLGLGMFGLAVLLAGLVLDATMHAANPDLAHQEGLFTLSNPGHLLLFVGLVEVVVGMVGATWTLLGLTMDRRRSRPAACLLLVGMAWITTLSVVVLSPVAVAGSATDRAGHVNTSADDHAHVVGSCSPTPAQLGAAARLIADTRVGLARFAGLRAALAAGYAPFRRGREPLKHYFNPAYVTDGRVLDPTRPEGLLYALTARGPVLVAAVYLMNHAGEPGRAVGGCLTAWHAHSDFCSTNPARGMVSGLRASSGRCPRGQVPWAAPPMLHTWVVDIPGGPFAAHGAAKDVFRQLRATPRPGAA
jgi:hypothetical protein